MDKSEELNKLYETMKTIPKNKIVVDNFIRAWKIINNEWYDKIICSISGGSDSDILLDICLKCDIHKKITYVWFNTGLEYEATKEHLNYLEQKYNIKIERSKVIQPIPTTCKKQGQPFISKYASEMLERLQRHNFKFKDGLYEDLVKVYPNCEIALKWWCNMSGEGSMFNINRNKYLKEFIILNPPKFKISNKCCKYAKKDVAHVKIKQEGYELNIYGVRRSEGGTRATAYTNCFDESEEENGYDNYRPLYWYNEQEKRDYEKCCGIEHSKCYTQYGLKRTGCAGCPFGNNFEEELKIMEQYEPKLFRAANCIFKDSYKYTREYRKFYEQREKEEQEKIRKQKQKQYSKIGEMIEKGSLNFVKHVDKQ